MCGTRMVGQYILELEDEIERWQESTQLIDASGDPGNIKPEDNAEQIRLLWACVDSFRHITRRLRSIPCGRGREFVFGVVTHDTLCWGDAAQAQLPKEEGGEDA